MAATVMSGAATEGFVPPPYPHDRLADLKDDRRRGARRHRRLLGRHAGRPDARGRGARRWSTPRRGATGYPATIGSAPVPRGRGRRGSPAGSACTVDRRRGGRVHRHEGAGRVAAAGAVAARPVARRRAVPGGVVPHLRDGRDARRAARGARAASTSDWHLDLARVADADAERALVLWLNDPANPTGVTATPERDGGVGRVGARAGHHRRERRVLRRVHLRRRRRAGRAGHRARPPALDGVLAVHSLSKRSNMAGLRAGFVAGDRELVALPRRDPQARRADDARAGPGRGRRRARRRRARRASSRLGTRRRRAVALAGARDARPRARRRPVHLLPVAAHRRAARATAGRSPPTSPRPACSWRRATSTAPPARATPRLALTVTDDQLALAVRAPHRP